jgi:hypothetical protein
MAASGLWGTWQDQLFSDPGPLLNMIGCEVSTLVRSNVVWITCRSMMVDKGQMVVLSEALHVGKQISIQNKNSYSGKNKCCPFYDGSGSVIIT